MTAELCGKLSRWLHDDEQLANQLNEETEEQDTAVSQPVPEIRYEVCHPRPLMAHRHYYDCGHRDKCSRFYVVYLEVWLDGRVVRTLDLRSIGHEFESRPLGYRVQPWASC